MRATACGAFGVVRSFPANPSGQIVEHGLSPASFYKFKAKYEGMNVSNTHRLKSLEDENSKLKRLLADTMLDNVVLKDLPGKT